MHRQAAEQIVSVMAMLGLIAEAEQSIDRADPDDRPDEQWSVTVRYDHSIIATVAHQPHTYEWSPEWGQALTTAEVSEVVVAWAQSRGLEPARLDELES
jgi:hypothetical protein